MKPTTRCRLRWLTPLPLAAITHPTTTTPPTPATTAAAEQWPALPRLWEEARLLDRIYNTRIARQ